MDVLISIKPKWCELILRGIKTMEIRKTRPKTKGPFKCYIYMTKEWYKNGDGYFQGRCCGKIIGEFVCDYIEIFGEDSEYGFYYLTKDEETNKSTCLSEVEMWRYGNGKTLFGWHISDLKIYDEPKKLSDFIKPGYEEMKNLEDTLCQYCSATEYGTHKSSTSPISGVWFCEGRWCESSYKKYLKKEFSFTRPPQSWCYAYAI